MIYFDNAATSPVDDEVYDAMLPYLKEEYGNPSSKYYCKAVNSKNAVEEARNNVAKLLGAKPEEIIFTAGASEATNLIIKGYLDYSKYYGDGRNNVITSTAEHKATLNVCRYLNGEIYSNNDAIMSLNQEKKKVDRGYSATFVDVGNDGTVDIVEFEKSISNATAISSFIYVNNEIGAVNDVIALSKISHGHNVPIHIDATQALGKIDFDVSNIRCDFLSASAHKIYGPKGIGCAFIKSDKYGMPPISALIHGGEQENGIRAGTLAVHNIVGFGKAAEIALRDQEKNHKHINMLDDFFVSQLAQIDDIRILGNEENRVKGVISLFIDRKNFNNERFIKRISNEFAVSTGSACSAGMPSHVIKAIGMGEKTTKIVRVSINKYSSQEEIDKFIEILK